MSHLQFHRATLSRNFITRQICRTQLCVCRTLQLSHNWPISVHRILATELHRSERCSVWSCSYTTWHVAVAILHKYCDEYVCVCVCVCVCLSARISTEPYARSQIFVHVAYGCSSVLLQRRWDTLCTFGFVDNIMFFLWWAVKRYEFCFERPISIKFTYLP